MKTKIPRKLLWLFLLSILQSPLPAEFRDFRNLDGKVIRAELVSHKDGKVTLRRVDGRTFTLRPNLFDPVDQLYIKDWMENTPVEISYRLEIEAEKRKTGGENQDLGYKRVKQETWAYRISLTNFSRDTPRDLTVQYKIFYQNRAEGLIPLAPDERAHLSMVRGEEKLEGDLDFNRTVEFLTKDVPIEIVDYDGAGERHKDELEGCLLRILDAQGHPVMEWRTDTSALSDLTWENTEEGHDRLRLDLFR